MGLPQTVKCVLPWKAKIPEMLAIPDICLDLVHANLWLITAPAENPKKNSLLYLAFSSPILFNSSVLWSITLIRKSSSSSKEKQQFPPFHVWPQTPFYMKINVVFLVKFNIKSHQVTKRVPHKRGSKNPYNLYLPNIPILCKLAKNEFWGHFQNSLQVLKNFENYYGSIDLQNPP